MNYKRIILVLVTCSIGFFAFVTLSTPDKPPMPKVKYKNEPTKVLQGSYGWETFTKSVQADSPVPPELVENINPTVVAPQGNLKVTKDIISDEVTEERSDTVDSNNNWLTAELTAGIAAIIFFIAGSLFSLEKKK